MFSGIIDQTTLEYFGLKLVEADTTTNKALDQGELLVKTNAGALGDTYLVKEADLQTAESVASMLSRVSGKRLSVFEGDGSSAHSFLTEIQEIPPTDPAQKGAKPSYIMSALYVLDFGEDKNIVLARHSRVRLDSLLEAGSFCYPENNLINYSCYSSHLQKIKAGVAYQEAFADIDLRYQALRQAVSAQKLTVQEIRDFVTATEFEQYRLEQFDQIKPPTD